jgi:hypothetical protein
MCDDKKKFNEKKLIGEEMFSIIASLATKSILLPIMW